MLCRQTGHSEALLKEKQQILVLSKCFDEGLKVSAALVLRPARSPLTEAHCGSLHGPEILT